jgi:thioredoxin-related protein
MLKYKLTILLLILIQSCFSQKLIETISKHNSLIIDKTKEYKLIIISDSGCGYCKIAYEKIKDLTSKIQIIILDYEENNRTEITKYNEYNFIYAKNITEIKNQDFFPKLFLYNKDNKLIWKKKGWFDNNLNKIKKKVNYH